MDILATSVPITKQYQGQFPTIETNWDSVVIPLLQVSTPKHGDHIQNVYGEQSLAWVNSLTTAGNYWQHFWSKPKVCQRQFQQFNGTTNQVAVLRPRLDTVWFSSPDLAPVAKLQLEPAM